MINKVEFVRIINDLKEANDFVVEVNNKARKLSDAIKSDFFNAQSLAISHEDLVIRLLENIFDETETIGWWIYELDYGREYTEGCLTENGKVIDVSTAEKLYDYLTMKGENYGK